MNFIDKILKKPDESVKMINRLKELISNRKKFYSVYKPQLYGVFSKSLKKEDGWTKDRTAKEVYRIPPEVYFSNIEYWDEIIKTRNFKKHPEWLVGNSVNKFVK